jgi:RNA polymerase sigma-70 factor (ECF subfamily)
MLEHAETLRQPGACQLQAAIAAGHAQGSSPQTLAAAYEALLRIDQSPVARLNHAVAVALAGDAERGLELVDGIGGLDGYRHFHAARADLLRRLGRLEEAHVAYARAVALTDDGPERRFLERRLGEIAEMTPE